MHLYQAEGQGLIYIEHLKSRARAKGERSIALTKPLSLSVEAPKEPTALMPNILHCTYKGNEQFRWTYDTPRVIKTVTQAEALALIVEWLKK